jgi:HPt (histidine-containing phosphotransfer) domain-containing protein
MSPSEETPILDRTVLERLCADLGGREGLPMVARLFAQTAERTLSQLAQAIDAADAHEVMRLAHALKSSSRYLGAQRVGRLAEEAEALGHSTDLAAVRERLDGLRAVISEATAALERELDA